MSDSDEEGGDEVKADSTSILYCGMCTLPPEYCEYGSSDVKKCKEWLMAEHPDVHEELERLKVEAGLADVTLGKKKRGGGGGGGKKKAEESVYFFVTQRNKKKFVTTVVGLETVGVDLKEASKKLSKAFACSCSITEDPSNPSGKALCIQGDVEDDLPGLLLDEFEVPEDKIFKKGKGGALEKVSI